MTSDIRNVLSLDVTKFDTAVNSATAKLDTLDRSLSAAGTVAANLDKTIGGLASGLDSITSKFKMLGDTVTAMTAKMAGIANGVASVEKRTSNAASGIDKLGSATKKLTGVNAEAWLKKYADNVENLAPAIKGAVQSIVSFDQASIASAIKSESAVKRTTNARVRALESEKSLNEKAIAERKRVVDELIKVEQAGQRIGGFASYVPVKRKDKNPDSQTFGTMVNTGESRLVLRDAAGKMVKRGGEEEQYALAALAAKQEREAVESVVKELRWRNGQIKESIRLLSEEAEAIAKKTAAEREAKRVAQENERRAKADKKNKAAAESIVAEKTIGLNKQDYIKWWNENTKELGAKQAEYNRQVAINGDAMRSMFLKQREAVMEHEKALQASQQRIGKLAKKIVETNTVGLDKKDYVKWWSKTGLPQVEDGERRAQKDKIDGINNLIKLRRQQAKEEEQLAAQEHSRKLASINALIKLRNQEAEEKLRAEKEQQRQHLESLNARIKLTQQRAKEEAEAERQLAAERKRASNEAIREARLLAAERKRATKEAADYERQQAKDIADMWKGMAGLWAASKIGGGMMSSVTAADERQRIEGRYTALNMGGPEGVRKSIEGAESVVKAAPNYSTTEAMKIYMATQAGMARPDHEALNAIVPEIAKMMAVLQRLFPQQGHNTENLGRNMVGIFETLGITHDLPKMLQSLDVVYRSLLSTQGKMTEADIETMFRKSGLGNTVNRNPESIYWDTAVASQMKVMGGNSGGAGGVSTFGTMNKMALKRALGGTRETLSATQNLIDFGVIDRDEFLKANPNGVTRNYRPVAWKDSEAAIDSPIPYLMNIVNDVKRQLAEGGEKTKPFTKGLDVTDDRELSKAFLKWVDQSIGNTSVGEQLKMLAPKDVQERIVAEVDVAKNAKSYSETYDKEMESYELKVDAFNARLDDLKVTVGNGLIPPFTKLIEVVTSFVKATDSFGKDNPLALQLTVAGVAAGGLVIALKSMAAVMGMPGKMASLVAAMVPALQRSGAATAMAQKSFWALGAAIDAVNGYWAGFASTIRTVVAGAMMGISSGAMTAGAGVKLLGTTVSATAMLIGKSFLRMIPLVGQLLLAWDMISLAANIEVGGKKIKDWLLGWMEDLGQWWELAWLKIKRAAFGALTLEGIDLDATGKWIKDKFNEVGAFLSDKWKSVKDSAVDAFTFDGNFLETAKNALFDWGRTVVEWFKLKFQSLKNTISDVMSWSPQEAIADLDKKIATLESKRAAGNAPPPAPPKPAAVVPPKPGGKLGDTIIGDMPKDGYPSIKDIGKKNKGDGNHREMENAFARQFYSADTKAEIERLKLDAVTSGESTFMEQARQTVIKMWAGGDLDDGKDPAKRKFLTGAKYDSKGVATVNGKKYDPMNPWGVAQMDWNASVSVGKDENGNDVSKNLSDLQREIAKRLELVAAVKGVAFAKEREVSLNDELGQSIDEMTGKTGVHTDAMKALVREFDRMEARTPGLKANQDFQDSRVLATAMRAGIDYANTATDLKQKTQELDGQNLTTERERTQAAVDAKFNAEKKKVLAVQASLEAQINLLQRKGLTETAEYERLVEARKQGEDNFTNYLKAIEKERERALMTPVQRMMEEWSDVYGQLQNAQVQWAEGFASTFTELLTTGKADFRSFVFSILADMAKMSFKNSMVNLMDEMTGKAGIFKIGEAFLNGGGIANAGVIGGLLNKSRGLANDGSGPLDPAVGGDFTGFLEKATTGIKSFMNSIFGSTDAVNDSTAATGEAVIKTAAEIFGISTKTTADAAATASITSLAAAATNTSFALSTLGNSGGAGGGGGILGAISSAFGFQSGASTAMPAGASDLANAMQFMAKDGAFFDGQLSFFANGGAFTNSIVDSPTLFAFANGGKFGVMGEAGAEAIMPLSRDGSGRLGVTVHGQSAGGAEAPVVNIAITVNNEGGTSTTSTGDEAGAWRKIADRVKTVVRQELVSQQRPGGVLYR